VAKIARIPPASVSTDDRSKLKTLDRDLKSVVFGQEPAIDALAAAIKMARSGLGRPDKPIGSFLFSGPTGVGKTEVAKQLAFVLGVDLIRFDMSEYMERHAVSRLIGAPPGYVGFDQGGLLTEAISKKPHAVLLLDEIEKAHPDVFNVLLQVMDHGTLTDNNGRKADFRSVIIIMTTNAGAETMNKATIGFLNTARLATRWPTSSGCSRPSSATVWTRRSASGPSTKRSSCAWSTSSCSSSKRSSPRRRSKSPSPTACASCWRRRASIR
jgi:ATP-dependent Clp protease ATP-binding subunit ClpA